MPRPNARTPVMKLIAVLNALAPWCDAHRETLARALPDEDVRGEVCRALAARLQARASDVLGERLDDRGASATTEALFGEVQRFLKSTDAAVQLALRNDARLARVRGDLFAFAPSTVRSVTRARAALLRVAQALQGNRALLDSPHVDPDGRAARAQGLLDRLTLHEARRSAEAAETRRAYGARDEARRDALQHIVTLHLAACALELDHPAPLRELERVYSTHNPSPRRRKRSAAADGDARAPEDARDG